MREIYVNNTCVNYVLYITQWTLFQLCRNIIQLSTEGEVNSSVHISRYEPILRGIVVLVLPNQRIKIKKGTFCKQKTSLTWSLFTFQLTVFRGSFFMTLLQIK